MAAVGFSSGVLPWARAVSINCRERTFGLAIPGDLVLAEATGLSPDGAACTVIAAAASAATAGRMASFFAKGGLRRAITSPPRLARGILGAAPSLNPSTFQPSR